VLAGELGRHCGRAEGNCDGNCSQDSVRATLKAYEDEFRSFTTRVQNGVGEPSILDRISWTPFTIGILNWVLWFVSLLKLDLFAGWILSEKAKGWSLPEYEELLRG
jgi:hypothetical protein